MICTSRAIVLKTVKYSESSIIVKMFTELFGVKSFMIRSVRKKNGKISPSLFQSLNLLEVVFINKDTNQLCIPREISACYHFKTLPFDVVKSSQAVFINELIYRSVREEEANKELFNFISQSIIEIDASEICNNNAHLIFSLKLTLYLGFFPLGEFCPKTPYFLLKEGVFSKFIPQDDFYLDQQQSEIFDKLLKSEIETGKLIEMTSAMRKKLLEKIIIYYQVHLIGFGEIKSLEVLSQLFHS